MGTVPEIQGDGFMALFGVPSTHEDDAERAVRAALACRNRIRVLNEGRSGLTIPETHSGVNSGEVMVGSSTTDFGVTVIGDVVNTASRLADLAPPGTVIVEEGTWQRTKHAIRYGRRRTFRAKGKVQPVVAFEAQAPRTSMPVGRRTHHGSDFVDRVMESEELAQELRAVLHERRARVVVVSAEPGAGKTRLASEFTRRNPDLLVLGWSSDRLRAEPAGLAARSGGRRDRRRRTGGIHEDRASQGPRLRRPDGERRRAPSLGSRALLACWG